MGKNRYNLDFMFLHKGNNVKQRNLVIRGTYLKTLIERTQFERFLGLDHGKSWKEELI